MQQLTPTHQFIIARGGWTYPAGSILGTINRIPIEEHMFFILQPILAVLLHSIFTHSTLLPFTIPTPAGSDSTEGSKGTVRTLRRRYFATSLWSLVFLAGAYLVNDAHQFRPDLVRSKIQLGMKGFYMGWIMVWISPVIGWLTYLGADLSKGSWKAWAVGSGWLCIVDTCVMSLCV